MERKSDHVSSHQRGGLGSEKTGIAVDEMLTLSQSKDKLEGGGEGGKLCGLEDSFEILSMHSWKQEPLKAVGLL